MSLYLAELFHSYCCTEISISFEKTSYGVRETDGRQDKLITLIKDDNVKTERDLEVVLQLAPASGIDSAIFSKQRLLSCKARQLISIAIYAQFSHSFILLLKPFTDQDFALEKSTVSVIVFPSNKQVKHVPFTVIDDSVAEFREQFRLLVSVPQNGGFRLGEDMFTTVYIADDDSDSKESFRTLF